MKVWIHVNGSQEGPYKIDELPLDRMNADTPVWYEGLKDWVAARDADAVAYLFAPQQETVDTNANTTYAPAAQEEEPAKAPNSYVLWSIVLTVLFFNPIGLVPIFTGLAVKSNFRNHDYAKAERMKEVTEWWFMVLIVTTLICAPFRLLI